MGTSQKRFKDPVHGYITVPTHFCNSLIDTCIFQRLRHIEQTSMRCLYPGARHDRFIHSLGVYHLGCKAIARIEEVLPPRLKRLTCWPNYRATFEIACLMHDCGHAPFSHTCEKFYNHTEQAKEGTDKKRANAWLLQQCRSDSRFASDFQLLDAAPADHEAFSAALMIDFFGDPIRELGADPVLAARMITGCRYDDPQTDEQRLANCLIALLHGEAIDVDKLDYLLRDTWASGVKNTAIDIDRLLHGIGIKDHGSNTSLYFDKSALSVVQSVVDARNYLHDWVFTHHTVKYYTELLDHSLRILARVITDNAPDEFWTRAFSVESFKAPVAVPKAKLFLPTDGDIVCLLKAHLSDDPMVQEYLSHTAKRFALWKTRAEFRRLRIADIKDTKKRREEIPTKLTDYCHSQGWGEFDASTFLVIDATSSHLQLSLNAIMIDMGDGANPLSYTTVMGLPEEEDKRIYRMFYVFVPVELKAHKQELVDRITQIFS